MFVIDHCHPEDLPVLYNLLPLYLGSSRFYIKLFEPGFLKNNNKKAFIYFQAGELFA